jgi:flagellar hook protein FlgE
MGSFKLRADGALMTQTGSQALGWTAVNGVVDTSVPASPLTLTIGAQSAPIPTSNMSVSLNLDSRGVAGAATGSFKVPVEVVDSLGNKHVLTMAFTKDPVTPNTWNYAASLPASDLATGGAVTLAGSGKLTFGPDGKLVLGTPPVTSDTITINGLSDSASKMTIKWSFVDSSGAGVLTQFATDSNVSAADQDGFEAAQLVSVKIGDQGKLLAEYSNGVEQVAGQLAIASIRNPDTLASAGGSAYTTTAATAGPTIGVAGTGGRGNVLGSSIEGSNVDIAREFTNLIVYQRGYQANARVITAADELSQDTINLKR